jgi:hypothetical protein
MRIDRGFVAAGVPACFPSYSNRKSRQGRLLLREKIRSPYCPPVHLKITVVSGGTVTLID